jgi:hypothetical protein
MDWYLKMLNIESMSLVELKQYAKTKKIKQYYIMKRADLIEILTMKELPFKYTLEKMTITEMRMLAKERGMRGFWSLSKSQLSDKLFASHNEKKDNGEASEHEDPEDENSY